ncbi:MAG: hypothetical protein AABX16_00320 [Nanoarchaeota archaeon]
MKWKEFLEGMKEGQKLLGEDIAQIINLILLSIAYILGVGITSLIAKIVGKHFLELNIDKNKKSYWEELQLGTRKKEEYYRQF